MMPPPITTTAASAVRGNVTSLPEKHPYPAPPGEPIQPFAPAPAPERSNPGRGEPAIVPRQLARTAPTPVAPNVVKVAAAGAPAEAPMTAKAELKAGHIRTPGAEPPLAMEHDTAVEKPALKADDPFDGLASLEAEMARLLGREKLP